MKNILYFLSAFIILFSCTDKVDLSKKLNSGKTSLAVDAFINNLPEKQKVVLTSTQYYFDNSGPKMASGAKVILTDLNTQQSHVFNEEAEGEYFSSLNGDSLLKTSHNYQLQISYKDQNYVSYSSVNRVVPIDSLTFEVLKDRTGKELPGYYQAELWAQDFTGPGDRYWIRHYKNGVRSLKPDDVGIGYDASAFSTGVTDGITFILPLRRFFINDNDTVKTWHNNDRIMVEIYSITDDAASFLAQVVTQSSLGGGDGAGGAIGALFATPPANVPTNIKNIDENGNKAVGFFCTSAVSRAETIVPVKFPYKP